MTELPRIILAVPRIFYALAILFGAFNIILPLTELSEVGYSVTLGGVPGTITKLSMARMVERAAYDSLFLAGIGLNAQILIAIWRNTRSVDLQEPAE
jgi:hypothetical protein